MHSSKVSLSKALSNAALSGFNHPYSCEYSESACDKETLDLCIFFFFNFNIFYKMLFSDGVGNDCFLSSCWDLNGGSSVHSVKLQSAESWAPWSSDPQADWWTVVRFLVVWTASIL